MAIPPLNDNGLLPAGIHDCTFQELRDRFGQNQWVVDSQSQTHREVLCQQRSRLCLSLEDYLGRLSRVGLAGDVLVDGSFVTSKPDPNDIDLVVVLPSDHDFSAELSPEQYSLLSKRKLRDHGYAFDILVAANGALGYRTALELFQRVRNRADLLKGLLRVQP